MPAEGLPWLEREDILSFEEITRLVAICSAMGVGSVRLTGGEPLVRRDFPRLVSMLRAVDGIDDLSVTTNGFLLRRDAAALVAAGVDRFNVSVDSLQRDRFYALTRRDALTQVLDGLQLLATFPEAHPIKVNAVAIRGFTEQEVLPFARLARSSSFVIRFIEYMPLDADRTWSRDQVLTGEEIRASIDAVYPLVEEPREPSATARVYRFADGEGSIGFINPVSEPFCSDCNRIRLTADGRLRTCLFSINETDLRGPLRAGAPTTAKWRRSSATRSGARSSSTTSASRASCSRPARCRRSAAEPGPRRSRGQQRTGPPELGTTPSSCKRNLCRA